MRCHANSRGNTSHLPVDQEILGNFNELQQSELLFPACRHNIQHLYIWFCNPIVYVCTYLIPRIPCCCADVKAASSALASVPHHINQHFANAILKRRLGGFDSADIISPISICNLLKGATAGVRCAEYVGALINTCHMELGVDYTGYNYPSEGRMAWKLFYSCVACTFLTLCSCVQSNYYEPFVNFLEVD